MQVAVKIGRVCQPVKIIRDEAAYSKQSDPSHVQITAK